MDIEILPTTIEFVRAFMSIRDVYARDPSADNYEVYVKAALDAACASAAVTITIGQLAALGIRLRFMRAGSLEWMHESLSATARRAVGVAILRKNRRG